MILVIRFIGVLNAAIWLGASVFFTFAAQGTFFSPEAKATGLHPFWPGLFAQLMIGKYFQLQSICAAIAIVHLLAEWVYLGRALHRLTAGLLVVLFLIGLIGGLVLQPKMREMHLVKYSMSPDYKPVQMPTERRLEAQASFSRWHGVAMGINLVVLGCLVFYFWRVTHPPDNLRFVGTTKFRS